MEAYKIIFGIQPYNINGYVIHLIEAFIANIKNGQPCYFEKKATLEIITSYKIKLSDAEEKLLQICEQQNLDLIVSKYPKVRGKQRTIQESFLNQEFKTAIVAKLERLTNSFIVQCKASLYTILYFDVQRKIYLPDISVQILDLDFALKAFFTKTVMGMTYELKIKIGDQYLSPSQHTIDLLASQPIVMKVDRFITTCNLVSGQKLTPFLSKKVIFIPKTIIPEYFKTVFRDLVSKIEVEAEGFEYDNIEPEPKPIIKFHENLKTTAIEVGLSFKYLEAIFTSTDETKNRIILSINDAGEPSVIKLNRNPIKEKIYVEQLIEFGFSKVENGRFTNLESKDLYGVINLIEANRSNLLDYEINDLIINEKKVCFNNGHLEFSSKIERDWFDVKLVLTINGVNYPFSRLIPNIKSRNRFFILDDDQIFIIPEEWMLKYSLLAEMVNIEEGRVKLAKVHYTILQDLEVKSPIRSENLPEIQIPKEIKATLRPYQIDGAKWLITHYENRLGACLADDMGLGKTLQTICLLVHIKNHLKPVGTSPQIGMQLNLFDTYIEQRASIKGLIVLPSSLIYNWESELLKFSPQLMVKKHLGNKRSKNHKELELFDIVLTTYQTAQKDEELLSKINFNIIILDESHFIKNKDSKIFTAISNLNAVQRVTLSGTPIENSLGDLWSQMQFINPQILGSYKSFNENYKIPIEKEKNKVKIDQLKLLLDPYILRRTKQQVIQDLPELDEQVFYSEMTKDQHNLYEEEKSVVRNQILEFNQESFNNGRYKIHVLNALMRLRQIANHPLIINSLVSSGKYEDVTNTIDTLAQSGQKTLVFSSFVSHLKIYESYLIEQGIGFTTLTGEDSASKRASSIERFTNDQDCLFFLMSIKAGGVGLNLTSASYVIILDPWWNPFVERQAIARAHRIGQQNKVTVLRFIAKNTVEEKILALQQSKIDLASNFVTLDDFPSSDIKTLESLLY